MRALIGLATIGLTLTALSASPAVAFDDTLPRYAPYRAHHAYAYGHCRRFTWRERCRPYKLGGYFVRNRDFRRAPWFR